jgi:hypothetical protein
VRRQVFPILFILVAQARTGSVYGLFGSYGRGTAADGPQYQRQPPLGRLPTAEVLLEEGWSLMESQGFQPLPVSWSHGLRAGSYPMPHRDPYRSAEDCVIDRLLAAQAELEQLILITLDPAFAPFPCQTLW